MDRKILSQQIPSDGLSRALEQAGVRMQASGLNILTPEILLAVFVSSPDAGAYRLLRRLAATRAFDWADLTGQADLAAAHNESADAGLDFHPATGPAIALGEGLVTAIHAGYALAHARGESQCGTEHALIGMCSAEGAAGRLLARFGVTTEAMTGQLPEATPPEAGAVTLDYVALARQGELAPVYARTNLVTEALDLLGLFQAGNLILVGPLGAGKRSLARALAQHLAELDTLPRFASLVEISEAALLDNPVTTIRAGARAARGGILFIPHIDRWFGGYRAEFPAQAGAELQKVFLDPAVAVLGTCTPERYRERLEADFVVARTSAALEVPPTDVTETTRILETLRPAFEAHYVCPIDPDCLPEAARLAGRYLPAMPLPGGAVHLLHRACAGETGAVVTAAGLRQTVAHLTGVPATGLEVDERARYAGMAGALSRVIVGQEEAIQALSRAVQAARLGLRDPRRPVGSFLFTGPTGVGKSELAKALARFMFGAEEALITLDMSEYMDKSSVTRLIGSPPGYIGSGDGGWLTNAVKRRPHSIVLFDEVEKADERVFDLLLQILDEGRLTSGQGETVSFRECVILMTSNLGQTSERAGAEAALRAHFRPEFLNRLDGVIPFQTLTPEQMGRVLDLLLDEEAALLAARGISLVVSEAARAWLLARNTHPEWGARPLRRVIHQYIRGPLVEHLLRDAPATDTATVTVDVDAEELSFRRH